MVKKIVDNFYLRNLAVLLIFLSPEILQSIAKNNGFNVTDVATKIVNYTEFFLYFIFHNRVLYEKFLRKRKYFLYIILLLPTMFIWRESTNYLYWLATRSPIEHIYQIRELKKYNVALWIFVYWADVVDIYISLGVYLAFIYFKKTEHFLAIENEKKELELKQLKQQLSPHFLFNALNNIYSYSLEHNNHSSELLLKLSELIRFIVANSAKQEITIKEEVDFIDNYITFEKERLGQRCVVNYHKNISNQNIKIAPFILFVFIENAFKHGTTAINRSVIDISIDATEQNIHLVICNPVHSVKNTGSTNIGLANTRRRLELLYPGNYILHIIEENKQYKTDFLLKLNQ